MVGNAPYALPVDVLRKFDPTLVGTGELENNEYIGSADDEELVKARIEGVEDAFEDKTGNALRERRVGSTGHPETYEYHSAEFRRYQHGIKVWLEHANVLPLDYEAGDRIEVRYGRDNWRDITSAGDSWEADYGDGWVRVYRRWRSAHRRSRAALDRNTRFTYRFGALGGSRRRGGQTTLSAAAQEGDETLEVEDPERMPRSGLVVVGGSEYARFSGKDLDAGELTGVSRGARGTDPAGHDQDGVVHYCPVSVREAVAARAAVELLEYDDWVDQLVEATDGMAKNQKVEAWNQEWRNALGKHSEASML